MNGIAIMPVLSEPAMGEAKRRKETGTPRQRWREGLDNRELLESSEWCGCGYCCMIYPSAEVQDWIDEPFGGQTAQCPYCGIDIVFGDAMMRNFGYPVLLQICSQRFGHEQFKKMCKEIGSDRCDQPQWRRIES